MTGSGISASLSLATAINVSTAFGPFGMLNPSTASNLASGRLEGFELLRNSARAGTAASPLARCARSAKLLRLGSCNSLMSVLIPCRTDTTVITSCREARFTALFIFLACQLDRHRLFHAQPFNNVVDCADPSKCIRLHARENTP